MSASVVNVTIVLGRAMARTAHFNKSSSSQLFRRWMAATTYYTPAHEYCKVEGNIATVGITDFAQSALGDIVFVDLPEIGTSFSAGDSFGSVESVKAASDVYAPISGKIISVNDVLCDEPGLVNSSPEDGAWFVKMEIDGGNNNGETTEELKKLLNAEEYKVHCEKEAH